MKKRFRRGDGDTHADWVAENRSPAAGLTLMSLADKHIAYSVICQSGFFQPEPQRHARIRFFDGKQFFLV